MNKKLLIGVAAVAGIAAYLIRRRSRSAEGNGSAGENRPQKHLTDAFAKAKSSNKSWAPARNTGEGEE